MDTFWLGALCGAPAGVILAAASARLGRMVRRRLDEEAVADAEQEFLFAEATAYAIARQEQVSEFADSLAGDDPLLRERLRRFERQSGQS